MLEVNALELTIILYSMAVLPWVLWIVYALIVKYVCNRIKK